ncbi:hypothetical protein DCM91_20875 [Chitinophaga costaii]|nr:hypothetical protein DCM91_20875 [Chitinophaga costaii]
MDEYEAQLRDLDPQIGRWWQIDPRSDDLVNNMERWSPYVSNKNSPILNADPKGDCPSCLVGAIIGFVVDAAVQISTSLVQSTAKGETPTLGTIWRDYNVIQATAATAAGAITIGLSAYEEAGVSLRLRP